ncbi:MAG: HAD-IA family hydrolase [Acidimicrobiales bacterium]
MDASLFDLDGVLTETASLHASAWKTAFDELLRRRAGTGGSGTGDDSLRPFDEESDYDDYVDGKPREHGVIDFLASRGIELAAGSPEDPAGDETVQGVGNAEDRRFHELLDQRGVEAYPGSVRLVEALRRAGQACAVVSSSRSCRRILEAAGIAELFDAVVDGTDTDRLGLAGKPDPAAYLEAAGRLGTPPSRSSVFEDALVGVEAGAAGGFGVVVGVDRHGEREALAQRGADIVVSDLSELVDQE